MKIRFTKGVYLACAAVMLLSLILALLFPTREILQSILATPGAAALVLALWQLLRDEANFAKERLLKQEERIHTLGVSSHMAEVAFDKHVEFSERYLKVMQEGIETLVKNGPCSEASSIAIALIRTRQEFAAWVTKETSKHLEPFEKAFSRIGINQKLLHSPGALPWKVNREAKAHEADDLFGKVLELHQCNEMDEADKAIGCSNVIQKVQALLGIEELTKLRQRITASANETLKSLPTKPNHGE